MMEEPPPKKSRGPYKSYQVNDDAPVPRQTSWNWKNNLKKSVDGHRCTSLKEDVLDLMSPLTVEVGCNLQHHTGGYEEEQDSVHLEPEDQDVELKHHNKSNLHQESETDPEPERDPKPNPYPEPDTDPEPQADPVSDPEPGTGSEPNPVPDPDPERDPIPDPETDAEPDPEQDSDPEPDPNDEPEPTEDPEPDSNQDSDRDPDPDDEPEPAEDPEPDPDQDSDAEPDDEPAEDPEPDPDQDSDAEPDDEPAEDPDPDPDQDSDPDPDDEPGNGEFDDGFPRRGGDEPIFNGASVTVDQCQVLLLAYIFKHNVSGDGLHDLLTLLDIFFPGILPRSKHMFTKQFLDMDNVKNHMVCKYCSAYIGCEDVIGAEGHCPQCNRHFTCKGNIKDESFFVSLPIRDQIKDILENTGVVNDMAIKSQPSGSGINDICTGAEMKNKMNAADLTDNDITLTFNIDGVPIFKSSNRSLWPIQCAINELKPDDRKRNLVIAGLWFGPAKPPMSAFLKPMIEEAQQLGTNGFQWKNPVSGANTQSRVFFVCATCDAVARPPVRNCTQFNGMYGCDWCLHPGERVEKGDGFVNAYPFVNPEPETRTKDSHEEDSIQAVAQGQAVHGVKGPSMLMMLLNFNIVAGFVVDYMHCVLLGVVRQFVSLWFDSHNHRQPWYIGTKVKDVDARLLAISPPSEITRTPRSLATRCYWKASEWRSFVLFYSSLILQGILPARYLQHWFLLVFATHNLLKNELCVDDIDEAELALKKFVILTSVLYGKEHMTFNIHQLCHWCESVRAWGAAWAHSAFPFEGNNRLLLKMFHGTQRIVQQMAKNFLLYRKTQKLANKCMVNASERCLDMFAHLTHTGSYRPVGKRVIGEVQLFGKSNFKQLEIRHLVAVQHLIGEELQTTEAVYCDRFQYRGRVYHSHSYGRCGKRDNSVFQRDDGTICRLDVCVVVRLDCHCVNQCTCVGTPIAIVNVLNKVHGFMFADQQLGIQSQYLHHVVHESSPLQAITMDRIQEKCVICKETANSLYVVTLPNNHERD